MRGRLARRRSPVGLAAIELLGAAAEAGALQLLDDHVQIGDPLLGALVDRGNADEFGLKLHRLVLKLPRLCLQLGLFRRHGNQHRLERVDIVGKGQCRARHGLDISTSWPVPALVSAA